MNIHRIFITAALALMLAMPAYAGELVSGGLCPLCGYEASPFIGCSVTNVSNGPLDVTVEIFDGDGGPLSKQIITIPPLATRVVTNPGSITTSVSTTSTSICRFSFKGPRGNVRAHACKADFLEGTTPPIGCSSTVSKAE